jgi:hypothetical protein
MESVQFNGHPWQAHIDETPSGLFCRCIPAFSVPVGYRFELRRGLRSWTVCVTSCTENPCGENETWLKLAIEGGPKTVVPVSGGSWKRKRGW